MPAVKGYSETKRLEVLPRLPLEGSIDLTYRCNNHCRHCWLHIAADAPQKKDELSFEEIKKITGEARIFGCRKWSISGGEPMLRPDFMEIFDYLTYNYQTYSLNTNGTLITPRIAQLMKRKGSKMVAVYGATAEVHDQITRNPGSFEAVMRGFRYLKEAGAGFTVQLIPMRDNYHQFKEMVALAESLSKHYRVGAAWLYSASCGDPAVNQEIHCQRLPAREVVELDKPDLSYEEWQNGQQETPSACQATEQDYLFSSCIAARRDFHIDPYGKMSFCCFVKAPELRYDLRKGNFIEVWDKFIPSLMQKVPVNKEYQENCGTCQLRQHCRNCPVYSYLEHGRFSAKVEYLCAVAKENQKFKEDWMSTHRRYFKIADITIQVDADLPMNDQTFHEKFKHFSATGPGEDTIAIRHHFGLPDDLEAKGLGKEVYRRPPWAVYQKDDSWIYLGISPIAEDKSLHRAVVFNRDHSRARIYNDRDEYFKKGGVASLTMFPTDQILFARLLADRQGCYLHSCGVVLDGKGMLFVGHSEAGKSTMATMLKGHAEILCDDRIIVRKKPEGFRIYGTWSHGDVPDVSGNSAPLSALCFIEKAADNQLIPITDKKEIARKLLSYLIKPFVTTDWWEKTLVLIEVMANEIPCYTLRFDKSGKVVDVLKKL